MNGEARCLAVIAATRGVRPLLHIKPFAERRKIARTRILKLLPLTQLGPKVLKAALTGTLPERITLEDLLAAARRLDWDDQAAELGLADPAPAAVEG